MVDVPHQLEDLADQEGHDRDGRLTLGEVEDPSYRGHDVQGDQLRADLGVVPSQADLHRDEEDQAQ